MTQPRVLILSSNTVPVGLYMIEEIKFDNEVLSKVIIKYAGENVAISCNNDYEHCKIQLCTGYTDANDRPIYEGDMIAISTPYGTECGRVAMSHGRYVVEMTDHNISLSIAVENNAVIV